MRRNRKVKTHSRFTATSVNLVVAIMLAFIAGMFYWAWDARCVSLQKEIGDAQRELKRLEGNCQRELSNWEELKTPDSLRLAFARHGLEMGPANQDQVIHMTAGGVPAPGQMSVRRNRAIQSRTSRIVQQTSPRKAANTVKRR